MSIRLVLSLFALVVVSAAASAQNRPAPSAVNLIDLNTASRDTLMSLEGIGEVKADAIIRSRPFRAKTDLVERHIIPEALYGRIADRVFARPPPPAPAPAKPAAPAPGGPTRRG